MTTRISVGILAHDEGSRIGKTLASLFDQDIFADDKGALELEIVVIPNGCQDDTAAQSQAALERLTVARPMPHVRSRVCELAEPGKSRSWNVFVHELSDPRADYLILMDGDIEFLGARTLRSLVEALERSPEASVSVGDGVKDVALKKDKGLVGRLSLAVKAAARSEYTWISGQLYCGRATELRKVWMPIGLPAEDGFLWAMVVTDRHTKPINGKRVIHTPEARHVFEAELDPWKLLRHERRIIVGMTINSMLEDHLRSRSTPERDAGQLIRDENARNAGWIRDVIAESTAKKGRSIIPLPWLFRRFSALRYSPMPRRLVLLPAVAIAFHADLLVFIAATHQMRSGQTVGFW